jgi:hypothetical protein
MMGTWDKLMRHELVGHLFPMSDTSVDALRQILNDIDSQSESSSSTPGDASEPNAAVEEYFFRAPLSDWRIWSASIERDQTVKAWFQIRVTFKKESGDTLSVERFNGEPLEGLAQCLRAVPSSG